MNESRPQDSLTVEAVRANFLDRILEDSYPCLGARSALRAGGYDLHLYDCMGNDGSTEKLAADLARFVERRKNLPGKYKTFIAVFREPSTVDDVQFEASFWQQLQMLHQCDTSPWDPLVSSEPDSVDFDFSFAGYAFFVVGMHSRSSRVARRIPWPTMVFNGHDQFVSLQQEGKWDSFQGSIRRRDIALQGSINPNLAHYAVSSNALQYSGREVDSEWVCPFRPDLQDAVGVHGPEPFTQIKSPARQG